jgi:hypothetical protein
MLYIESNIVSLGVPVYRQKQNRKKIKLHTFGLHLHEYCHHDIKKEKVLPNTAQNLYISFFRMTSFLANPTTRLHHQLHPFGNNPHISAHEDTNI